MNKFFFIYTFPNPKETPNFFNDLLIFDKDKKWRWKYFTLELDYVSSIFLNM